MYPGEPSLEDAFLYCITGKGSPGFQRDIYLLYTRKVFMLALRLKILYQTVICAGEPFTS